MINGQILKQAVISGANNISNQKNSINDLNIFPVPDGDTGTNMSMTVNAAVAALEDFDGTCAGDAAGITASAMLRGARGNSGVITSLIFRGFAQGLKDIEEVDGKNLAAALGIGVDAAYKAVMKPTEGTILTVARMAYEAGIEAAKYDRDVVSVWQTIVDKANEALAITPQLLPVLKKAGVVDAGGQGWMFVLEGALSYIKSGNVVERQGEALETQTAPVKKKSQEAIKTEDIKFKYCTEFIVEKKQKGLSVSTFRDTIAPKGDCMLVIDDDEIVKVHIHTNHPGFVLEEAIKLGEMINLKIDNMKHQHKSIIDGSNEQTSENAEVKTAEVKAEKKTEKPKKAPKPKAPVELKEYGFEAV